jgi:hypothetical protein
MIAAVDAIAYVITTVLAIVGLLASIRWADTRLRCELGDHVRTTDTVTRCVRCSKILVERPFETPPRRPPYSDSPHHHGVETVDNSSSSRSARARRRAVDNSSSTVDAESPFPWEDDFPLSPDTVDDMTVHPLRIP